MIVTCVLPKACLFSWKGSIREALICSDSLRTGFPKSQERKVSSTKSRKQFANVRSPKLFTMEPLLKGSPNKRHLCYEGHLECPNYI